MFLATFPAELSCRAPMLASVFLRANRDQKRARRAIQSGCAPWNQEPRMTILRQAMMRTTSQSLH
jgi:hypothetical protein